MHLKLACSRSIVSSKYIGSPTSETTPTFIKLYIHLYNQTNRHHQSDKENLEYLMQWCAERLFSGGGGVKLKMFTNRLEHGFNKAL